MSVRGVFLLGHLALVATLLAGLAAPASAQIYSWRDEAGVLTFSNRPRGVPGLALAPVKPKPTPEIRPATHRLAGVYDDLIVEHALKHGVRPELVRAVVQVESAFNPLARSPKGALGLMQLMPATARQFNVSNPLNPAENVGAGVAYLRQLLDRYGNNEKLALAAYNAGPGAVDRYGQRVPPFRETRDYVSRVDQLAGTQIGTRPVGTRIYKTVRIVNGVDVVLYTDRNPAGR